MDTGGQALGNLLHCTESAQKNINTHTLALILTREFGNSKTKNSPNLVFKYFTVMSTGSKKSSGWHPLSRVYPAVASQQ